VRERGAGALAAAEPVAAKPGAVGAKSRVVVARDELLRGTDSKVDSGRMLALLDRAMQALAGHDHPAENMENAGPSERNGEPEGELLLWKAAEFSTNVCLLRPFANDWKEAGVRASDIVVLGPRQQRTGARRISSCDGRKSACRMLRTEPRGL